MTTVSYPPVEVISQAVIPGPTWWQGQAVNEWREISGSSMSLCPPTILTSPGLNPQNRTLAWIGYSLDTRNSEVWSLASGGHADYSGNEVVSIRLSDNAPVWVERMAASLPSAVGGGSGVNSNPYYDDGKPCSRHSYTCSQFITARNRAMQFGVGSKATSGNADGKVDGFNINTNLWDAPGTYPDLPVIGAPSWSVAKHFTTEDVYTWSGFTLRKWTQATNAWSSLPDPPRSGYEAASAIDTTRNRIFMMGGEANTPCYYSITSNTYTTLSLSGSQAGQFINNGRYGMVYIPEIDKFLARKSEAGSAVYTIDPVTFATELLTVTGGGAIPATGALIGPYTKFLRCPQLRGVAWYPLYAGNWWFLRTH